MYEIKFLLFVFLLNNIFYSSFFFFFDHTTSDVGMGDIEGLDGSPSARGGGKH